MTECSRSQGQRDGTITEACKTAGSGISENLHLKEQSRRAPQVLWPLGAHVHIQHATPYTTHKKTTCDHLRTLNYCESSGVRESKDVCRWGPAVTPGKRPCSANPGEKVLQLLLPLPSVFTLCPHFSLVPLEVLSSRVFPSLKEMLSFHLRNLYLMPSM